MKNIKLLSLFALLGVGALFFSSCGSEKAPEPKPVLNFIGGADFVSSDVDLTANTAFQIAITASHVENITSFRIIRSLDGSVDEDVSDTAEYKTKVISEYIYMGTTGPDAGTEIYTFIVADKNGNSTTKAITIRNLGDPGRNLETLTEDNDGNSFRVFNFRGPNEGAFGITVGSPLFQSFPNSEKDIQDSISEADTDWPARWTSRNGTTFKKLSDDAWNTVTNDATIAAAWEFGGTAQTTVSVAEGDVYVLNLAGSDVYSLVRVVDVVSTPSDNLDYVEFEFKRQLK
jgi:hypothetical protein